MPAENEFEQSMQQLLDGLRVDPAPADWQAVYEQLHPRRKRRIIWWWLPLAAALLFTALWMQQEPTDKGEPIAASQQGNPAKADPAASIPKPEPEDAPAAGQPLKPSANTRTAPAPNPARHTRRPGFAHEDQTTSAPAAEVPIVADTQTTSAASSTAAASLSYSTADTASMPLKTPNQNNGLAYTSANTTSSAIPDTPSTARLSLPAATNPMQADTPVQPVAQTSPKRKQHSWQWLLYAGAGLNATSKPPGGTKAAMELSNSLPGGAILITQSETSNGYHLAAGALAQRQWHKNWKLQLGLGLNNSQWKGHTTLLRDSLPTGSSVAARSLVSERHSQYNLWMLEIPMEIGLRLAGRKENTWWWTTGFNHQVLLSLQENHSTQQAATNFASTSGQQSLSSAASHYQLSWRMGLQLNHDGKKARWQMAPLFQYGLTPLYKQDANNTHLLQLQMQFRLFLSKRGEKY